MGSVIPDHWPQPRKPGFGAGLLDFEAYAASDPNFTNGWAGVQSQLVAELADSSQINLAKTAFTNSFEQLAANMGVTGDEAIAAAKQFTTLGHTVLGAVSTVQGLITTVESGSAPAITQAFTGVLISIGVGSGLVSAGVGAAIAFAITAVLAALGDLGFFTSNAPPTYDIPGCGKWTSVPDYLIGCMGVWAKGSSPNLTQPFRVAPGSPNWRSFPQPGTPGPYVSGADKEWFVPNLMSVGIWKGILIDSTDTGNLTRTDGSRAIDRAFPSYGRLAADAGIAGQIRNVLLNVNLPAAISPGSNFQKAFFSAWRSNAEYALNGLKPRPDEEVLIHTLRLWNRAHAGPPVVLSQSEATYAHSLVSAGLNLVQSNDVGLTSGAGLLVNSGAMRTQTPQIVKLHLSTKAGATSVGSSAPMSTTTKVVAGTAAVGGAALLGTAVFAFATHKSIDTVFSSAWRGFKGWFK